jgi:hypothetical protein
VLDQAGRQGAPQRTPASEVAEAARLMSRH